MWWAVKQLAVPCNYLRIRSGRTFFQSKIVYDWVLPALLTIGLVAIVVWIGAPLAIFQHPGIAKWLIQLLALMIVFFLAALAAVATFERKGIDDRLAGDDATLSVRNRLGGGRIRRNLSYRQFISYLFGYLSFLALLLFLFVIFATAGWPKIEQKTCVVPIVHRALVEIVDPVMFVVLFFALWQLFVTALLGIYFLTERIQSLNEENH